MCQRYGHKPSSYFGFKNESLALGFDLACDVTHSHFEAEQKSQERMADMQDTNIAMMLAYSGKPVEFEGNDSFHSAGTSRKRRKSDDGPWITI